MRPHTNGRPLPSTSSACMLLDLFAGLHEMSLAISHLRGHLLVAGSCVHQHKLKLEVEASLAVLDECSVNIRRLSELGDMKTLESLDMPWLVKPEAARQWIAAFDSMYKYTKRVLLLKLLDDLRPSF